MEGEPVLRVVLPIMEEPLKQDNSMQPESLKLQSCLTCWQMRQSQDSGRSAGTQSCPFLPAGIGLMALCSVGRQPCALLCCIPEPQ